jgi:hypothetical protein
MWQKRDPQKRGGIDLQALLRYCLVGLRAVCVDLVGSAEV